MINWRQIQRPPVSIWHWKIDLLLLSKFYALIKFKYDLESIVYVFFFDRFLISKKLSVILFHSVVYVL